MHKLKKIQIPAMITGMLLLSCLVSCSSAPKSSANASPVKSSSGSAMSMQMNMDLLVLFKRNTTYTAIHKLNEKLSPEHSHVVLKSKKLFKYTFTTHKSYMSGKDILTQASIVDAVSKYQASEAN